MMNHAWKIMGCFVVLCSAIVTNMARASTYIYATDFSGNRVVRFDAATGASELVVDLGPNSNPRGVALDNQGRVYVGLRSGSQNIKRYDPATGTTTDFTSSIGGFGVGYIDFDSNGDLIAGGDVSANSSVFRYDGQTGALIDTFNFPGNTNVVGLEVDGLTAYSAAIFSGNIAKYDLSQSPVTGSQFILGSTIPTTERERAWGMTVGHNGNLFVTNKQNVSEFDINTGQFLGVFLAPGALDIFYYQPLDSYFITSTTGRTGLQQYASDGTFIRSYDFGGSNFWALDVVNVVPEPTSLTLLSLGGLAVLRRRR